MLEIDCNVSFGAPQFTHISLIGADSGGCIFLLMRERLIIEMNTIFKWGLGWDLTFRYCLGGREEM